MTIYLMNIILLLLVTAVFKITEERNLLIKKKGGCKRMWFMAICFLLLFLEMAFRGDFAHDTVNYYKLFMYDYNNGRNVLGLLLDFSQRERGFLALNEWIHLWTDNYIYLCMITAAIIAWGYTRFLYLHSDIAWISMLVLLCSGSFYTGFNIMRQILAAGLYALCFQYLVDRKPVKYIVAVYLITLFHTSAWLMMPLYFVLNLNLKKVDYLLRLVIILAMLCLLYLAVPYCVQIASDYIYSGRWTQEAYGIAWGVPLLGTIKALILGGIVLCFGYLFDYDCRKERVIYNGTVLYLVASVGGARVFMVQRFVHYFVPFLMLAYPVIVKKQKDMKNQMLCAWGMTAVLLVLSINVILSDNYYFFWDNQIVSWGF